jgi:hypothetical protein
MEAIELNGLMHTHPYACRGLSVNPDPPRVGEVTTLAVALKNAGAQPITVKRIEFMVAQFGMGVRWEQLPPIEDLTLPARPDHVEEIAVQWTPTIGGHRCVRVAIHSDVLPIPLRIGRNLHVIEATAERTLWQVPFRLGNPENDRMPVALELGDNNPDAVEATILINGRVHGAGQPIWLGAREEVEARLLLRARTDDAIATVKTLEARIQGRLIDGIQVEVYRPAHNLRRARREPAPEPVMGEYEFAGALVR